jgi:ParB family chromosome partitioning protein
MAGFDITKILNKQTTAQTENAVTEDFEEIKLDYGKIVITGKNKYSMNDIEDLAAGIEMAGGLLDPLILGRVNGEYKLAGGHRRYAAVDLLVKDGKEEYREVPCKYKDMTETEFRLYMLIGNTFNRHYTDYDKMIEAEEWKEVLTQAKEEGSFLPEKGVRVRDYIAKIMKTSAAVVGDWNRINNNGTDALKEQFEAGTIGVTAAAAASSLPEEEQNDIAERAAAGEDIRNRDQGNDRTEEGSGSSAGRRHRAGRNNRRAGRKDRRGTHKSHTGTDAAVGVGYRHNRRRKRECTPPACTENA